MLENDELHLSLPSPSQGFVSSKYIFLYLAHRIKELRWFPGLHIFSTDLRRNDINGWFMLNMRPEHSKSSIYYAVLLKKKLVVLNDKLIRNIQNNIQVSSLNWVLIAPLIKMGIEGTFDTNELKFHLPRTLCILLIRFTPNTIIVGLINSKRAFVSLLSLFLGINYSCDSLPGCSCYFVLWGINRDRKHRSFKQIPYHKLFADMFSIHSEEPFSLFLF